MENTKNYEYLSDVFYVFEYYCINYKSKISSYAGDDKAQILYSRKGLHIMFLYGNLRLVYRDCRLYKPLEYYQLALPRIVV